MIAADQHHCRYVRPRTFPIIFVKAPEMSNSGFATDWSGNQILDVSHSSELKLLSSTSLWYCLLCCFKMVAEVLIQGEIPKCDHSNESY